MKKEKYVKGKMSYDFEHDIIFACPIKRNYDSSFQIGNFIFDIDKSGKIIGFEILNASKIFGISKLFLKNRVSSDMYLEVNDKYIKLNIKIKSVIRNAKKSSVLNIERIRPDYIQQTELRLAIA